MPVNYLRTLLTPDIRAQQRAAYDKVSSAEGPPGPEPLGPKEIAFIDWRDSFYFSTVNSDGWPYVQHRGGPTGFLRVLDPSTLAFADYSGNRQLISAGNLQGDDRVSLFLMDYPNRTRLKIIGRARTMSVDAYATLDPAAGAPGDAPAAERYIVIGVAAYDWNCSKYITPRFSEDEVRAATAPLRERIEALEAEVERLRRR